MAINLELAQQHIAKYTTKLSYLPRCKNWPRYLYHSAHAQVVVEILRSGQLKSRKNQSKILHDVANPGAVANNPDAHQYARLYFRPKNGFHLRTEGIKCLGDIYRLNNQMSIPVTLAFSAESLLSLQGVGYTNGNLASDYTTPVFNEQGFNDIPFDIVYHDKGVTLEEKETIHYHRMAEVLYPGNLALRPHLKKIICRSQVDKTSLLDYLGDDVASWTDMISVEQTHGSIFFHWGLYISDIKFIDGDLHMFLTIPRNLSTSGKYEIEIRQFLNDSLLEAKSGQVPVGTKHAIVKGCPDVPDCRWEIFLEQVIAFRGKVPTGGSLLV